MKLSFRIPLLIGSLVILTSGAIGGGALFSAIQAMTEADHASLQTQALINAELVEADLWGELHVLEAVAAQPAVRSMDWVQIQPVLIRESARLDFAAITFVSADGIAHYPNGEESANLSDRPYFKDVMAGKGSTIPEVLISRVTNLSVCLYVVPVKNEAGEVAGMLMGRRNGSALSAVLERVKTNFATGYACLIGDSGTTQAHPNANLVNEGFNAIEAAKSDTSLKSMGDAMAYAIEHQKGVRSYTYNGRSVFAAFANVEELPFTLLLIVEEKEFTAGLKKLRVVIVGFGVLFVIAGIGLAILIGGSITRPIGHVTATLKDISEGEGDLTRTITLNTKRKKRDEIGFLAHYFNRTLDKIRRLVVDIRGQTEILSRVGNELGANMNETAAAVNQITANIQHIKDQVMTQTTAMGETNAAMDSITGSIDEVVQQISRQNQAIHSFSSTIEEMLANIQSVTQTLVKNSENVEALQNSSEAGRRGLQEVAADIQEIAEESVGLLKINGVMENIASQTNLLSMNAAIEAAHAGESGKGFAVVAGEIRKLAENSGRQSKTINGVLKKITSSIEKISRSTEIVLNEFQDIDNAVQIVAVQEEHIRTAMEEQAAGSKQILDAVAQVNDITRQVKDGSTRMSGGSQRIIQESRKLEQVTAEIAGGMNEMAIGADQINAAVHRVNDISTQNRDCIAHLVKDVSRFIVE